MLKNEDELDRGERPIKLEIAGLSENYLGSASCITNGGRALFRLGGHPDLQTDANSEYQSISKETDYG